MLIMLHCQLGQVLMSKMLELHNKPYLVAPSWSSYIHRQTAAAPACKTVQVKLWQQRSSHSTHFTSHRSLTSHRSSCSAPLYLLVRPFSIFHLITSLSLLEPGRRFLS